MNGAASPDPLAGSWPWDAAAYEAFVAAREQPFLDLMARLPARRYATIIDAGCGTGRTSCWLADHFDADVVAIDASPEMLARAPRHPRVRFEQADIRTWSPPHAADLVVANAVLHWIPQPEATAVRLTAWTRDLLAIQVPVNLDAPSHRIVDEVAASGPWASTLEDVARGDNVLPTGTYQRLLEARGFAVTAWDHEYRHVLPGDDAVLQWLVGTTLRPYLARLVEHREPFLAALGKRLQEAYPAGPDGTVLPFRRRFVVACRMDR